MAAGHLYAVTIKSDIADCRGITLKNDPAYLTLTSVVKAQVGAVEISAVSSAWVDRKKHSFEPL